jgi:hypothetical protein
MNIIDKLYFLLDIPQRCDIPKWIDKSKLMPTREGGRWVIKGRTFSYTITEPGVGDNDLLGMHKQTTCTRRPRYRPR